MRNQARPERNRRCNVKATWYSMDNTHGSNTPYNKLELDQFREQGRGSRQHVSQEFRQHAGSWLKVEVTLMLVSSICDLVFLLSPNFRLPSSVYLQAFSLTAEDHGQLLLCTPCVTVVHLAKMFLSIAPRMQKKRAATQSGLDYLEVYQYVVKKGRVLVWNAIRMCVESFSLLNILFSWSPGRCDCLTTPCCVCHDFSWVIRYLFTDISNVSP